VEVIQREAPNARVIARYDHRHVDEAHLVKSAICA
jgi:hypothetical protein